MNHKGVFLAVPFEVTPPKLEKPEKVCGVDLGRNRECRVYCVIYGDRRHASISLRNEAWSIHGLKLVGNIAAMLIAFLALVALVNAVLGWFGSVIGLPQLSLELIFSFLLAPVAWLMGVPWADCGQVGVLLGKKTILNEFIAYVELKELIEKSQAGTGGISQRAIIIATYALCGFSNISSIGIQIGGIGGIAPERQADLARLGVRALIGGSLACFMTACIAGMLL
jgi:CNT family concentrative nucleoside transporter